MSCLLASCLCAENKTNKNYICIYIWKTTSSGSWNSLHLCLQITVLRIVCKLQEHRCTWKAPAARQPQKTSSSTRPILLEEQEQDLHPLFIYNRPHKLWVQTVRFSYNKIFRLQNEAPEGLKMQHWGYYTERCSLGWPHSKCCPCSLPIALLSISSKRKRVGVFSHRCSCQISPKEIRARAISPSQRLPLVVGLHPVL